MTAQEIVYLLKTDFAYLVTTIVNNNPLAVRDNLARVYDAPNIESKNAIIDVVMQFHDAGQEAIVKEILSVPFLRQNANDEQRRAWELVKGEVLQARRTEGMTTLEFSDWSGGMFAAIGQIGSSFAGGQQETQPGGVVILPPQPEPRNNTIWYVLGGVVVVVILAVVLFKKK